MTAPKMPDPRLAVVRDRATRLRAELDRCDAAAADYTGAGRDRILGALLDVRRQLDRVDQVLDLEAAGGL